MDQPKFTIGQLVRQLKFGYRGVVVDIDTEFSLSNEWYEQVARSRPPKGKPWYRVLVHGQSQETYVAERHLDSDGSAEPISHPELDRFFDVFERGHYTRRRNLN
jgi:heat shock protein HspQ